MFVTVTEMSNGLPLFAMELVILFNAAFSPLYWIYKHHNPQIIDRLFQVYAILGMFLRTESFCARRCSTFTLPASS